MKKETFITIMAAIILLIGMIHSSGAAGEVNINVGIKIPPPPPLMIPVPPPMFIIPEFHVYFPP